MKKIFTLISIISVSAANVLAQATPNAGFETWTTTGFPAYAVATGWDSPNSQTNVSGTFVCIKATAAADVHSGSAAIKLVTKSVLGQIAPGIATTGTLPTSNGNPITGGIPYTLRPDSIVGYYKYTPSGGENGFVEFRLNGAGGDNDSIAVATFKTPTTTVGTYTRFSKPLTYYSTNAVVKSMWILCSSKSDANPQVGSTLFIDDLNLVWASSSNVTEQTRPEISVGPNPVYDNVIISNTSTTKAIFLLYDLTGRKVVEEKISNNYSSIDISKFPVGLYIYSIKDEQSNSVKTGKIIIQK